MPITWIEGEPSAAKAAAIFNGTLINEGREREAEAEGEGEQRREK